MVRLPECALSYHGSLVVQGGPNGVLVESIGCATIFLDDVLLHQRQFPPLFIQLLNKLHPFLKWLLFLHCCVILIRIQILIHTVVVLLENTV